MTNEKKVRDAAKLIHLSNRISEVQEKNIKMYPYVFFENVRSAKVDYDLSHKRSDDSLPEKDANNKEDFYKEISKALKMTSNSYVSYSLELDEVLNQPHLEKRFDALEKALRSLFWNDLTVEVYFNGKIAYKSAK